MASSLPSPTDCCSDDPCGNCTDETASAECTCSGLTIANTVADLRLVDDDGNLRLAVVFGNLVVGDQQARNYRWNPIEAGADDGVHIIRPSSQLPGVLGAWVEA